MMLVQWLHMRRRSGESGVDDRHVAPLCRSVVVALLPVAAQWKWQLGKRRYETEERWTSHKAGGLKVRDREEERVDSDGHGSMQGNFDLVTPARPPRLRTSYYCSYLDGILQS